MQNNISKATYTRLIYSVFDYFLEMFPVNFDVSSYLQNKEKGNCRITTSKIGKFIRRNSEINSCNRLFITISLNDSSTKEDGRSIIKSITNRMYESFYDSSCFKILKQIDDMSRVEIMSTKNHTTLTGYLVLVFYVSSDSSIEFIISTDTITSKLIEKDEDGDVVDFHSKLHKNIQSFQRNL